MVCASMVQAIEDGDVRAIGGHTSASFNSADMGKAEFLDRVEAGLNGSEFEDASVTVENIEIENGRSVVVLRVKCTMISNQYEGPMPSKWRIEFARSGDHWLMIGVQPIRVGSYEFNDIRDIIR